MKLLSIALQTTLSSSSDPFSKSDAHSSEKGTLHFKVETSTESVIVAVLFTTIRSDLLFMWWFYFIHLFIPKKRYLSFSNSFPQCPQELALSQVNSQEPGFLPMSPKWMPVAQVLWQTHIFLQIWPRSWTGSRVARTPTSAVAVPSSTPQQPLKLLFRVDRHKKVQLICLNSISQLFSNYIWFSDARSKW